MEIELLTSRAEKIIESLPTDERLTCETNKLYRIAQEEFNKKYRHISPT